MEITNDVKLTKTWMERSMMRDSEYTETIHLQEPEQREFLLWIKKNKPDLFKEVAGEL